MEKLKEELIKYDENIEKGNESFKIIEGKRKILVSAPHAVNHFREGKLLFRETLTGAIVQKIAADKEVWGIYKNNNLNDDANYDLLEENEYKKKIVEIIKESNIKILLDIHGCKKEREFNVELGTAEGFNLCKRKDILNSLINILKKNKINNIEVDTKFKAGTYHTISYTIAKELKIPAIQIEINGNYRDIDQIMNLDKLITSLEEWINEIEY